MFCCSGKGLPPESLVAKPATEAACIGVMYCVGAMTGTRFIYSEAEDGLVVIPNLRRVLHPYLP